MHLFRQLSVNSEHLYLKMFCNKMKTLSSFNGQIVRLLYSDKSRILCVHLLNIDPYSTLQRPGSPVETDDNSL